MATIKIKSNLTPEHTQPIDIERFCHFNQAEQHFPLLIKTFGKREPGEVLEVVNRAGDLKLRLVYNASKNTYANMTHGEWSEEHGCWMPCILFSPLEHERRFNGKRYKLCSCTREIRTSTRYARQHLVEQLHPGCTLECDGYSLSTVILQTFDAVNDTMQALEQCRDEAMQALEAVGEPVRYSDCGDYFWVEEHFVDEYDVQLKDEDDDEEIEEFAGTDFCQWPDELSYRGCDYRWSAADNQYIEVPEPDDDEDTDDEDTDE